MTDRPILFSPDMVLALLDDRKFQTRRVLKPQPYYVEGDCFPWKLECGIARYAEAAAEMLARFNKVQPGDRLWVREAWRTDPNFDRIPPRDLDPLISNIAYETGGVWPSNMGKGKYRPPMFMPRWASRLTLTVTDVRVQRVQDISEDDAKSEGIELLHAGYDGEVYRNYFNDDGGFGGSRAAIFSFRTLWDSLNDARGYGWDANPWVSATTFTLERRNIDE